MHRKRGNSTEKEPHVIQLLWTGGWDSTFRLLQLLLNQKSAVQPHYLIDTNRRSTGDELYAMDKIKQKLFSFDPNTRYLLKPTIFYDILDLPNNAKISQCFSRMRMRIHIGSQYEWLAIYCIEQNLDNVEIGIITGIAKILRPMVTSSVEGNYRMYYMDDHYQKTDEYILFQRYHFPLFDFSKLGVEKIVKEMDWLDIMDLTWFCHTPRFNHTPCGKCTPCAIVMEQDMKRRMPFTSQMYYYLTLQPMVRKNNKLYQTMRKFKHIMIPKKSQQVTNQH